MTWACLYCPICGADTTKGVIDSNGMHRCNEKTLARMDAARKAERTEGYQRPSYGSRLAEGFKALGHDERD